MDILCSSDEVMPDNQSVESRQSIPYRRNCGVIEGDFSELTPFIYIFQHGNCGQRFNQPMSSEATGIFGVNGQKGNYTFFRRGVILPLASCRDEKMKLAFFKLRDCVAPGPVTSDVRKRRNKAQRILRNAFKDRVRVQERADLDGCIELDNNSELFELLFENFEYLQEIQDNTNGPAVPVKLSPFISRSYGEFLEKFHRNLGDTSWGFSHCKIVLLFDAAGGIDPFVFSRRCIENSVNRLHKNFSIKRGVTNQAVTVKLEQEKRWDWIYLHLQAGKENVSIVLSNTFPPFQMLIAWLKSISRGEMPVWFDIDEEGTEKRMAAYPTENMNRILLHVGDPYDRAEFLNSIVSREELVEAFRVAIRDFFRNEFDPEPWSNHGEDDLMEVVNSDPWFAQ